MLILWGQGMRRSWGTDIGDVNIGGLGTDMGLFNVHIMGVGEFWDRHWGYCMGAWVKIGDVNIVRRWGFVDRDLGN